MSDADFESQAGTAVTIDELVLADEPERWAALGFTVDAGVCQLGAVRLRLAGHAAGRGVLGWSLRGIASVELDGQTAGCRRPSPTRRFRRKRPPTPTGCCRSITSSRSHQRSIAASGRCGRPGWTCAGSASSRPRRERHAKRSSGSGRRSSRSCKSPTTPSSVGADRCGPAPVGPCAGRRGPRPCRARSRPARGRDPARGAAGAADRHPAPHAGLSVPVALISRRPEQIDGMAR